jgi:hypothetical protein
MPDMSQDVLKNSLTNPAKSFLWEVMFTNPVGGGDADALDTRCQSTSIPGRGTGTILIPYKGTPGIQVPGKLTMSHSWAVTFLENTEDRKTFDALHAWNQAIVHDRLGVGGPDPLIKADIYLRCLDQEGTVWLTIKLIGCFPADVGEVSLSYEDNSTITFPCTFSFDRWEKVE